MSGKCWVTAMKPRPMTLLEIASSTNPPSGFPRELLKQTLNSGGPIAAGVVYFGRNKQDSIEFSNTEFRKGKFYGELFAADFAIEVNANQQGVLEATVIKWRNGPPGEKFILDRDLLDSGISYRIRRSVEPDVWYITSPETAEARYDRAMKIIE